MTVTLKSVNDLIASHVLREAVLLVMGGCTLLAWCKNRKGAEEKAQRCISYPYHYAVRSANTVQGGDGHIFKI